MTSFAAILQSHLSEADLNQAQFARRVGTTRGFVNNVLHGRRTPPLDEIGAWADVLALKGAKRDHFLELAELAHAPERLARRYLAMQERLRVLEERLGKPDR